MNNENLMERIKNIKPVTIWFTGLSASGKSTLSKRLYDDLFAIGIRNLILLDGEEVRERINNNAFDNKSREEVGILKSEIALEENKKGNIVLISGIASKCKWRKDIRDMMDGFFEIYLKCSVNVCADRDYKGHYKKAMAGEYKNFVGVTEDYEEHEHYDLMLDTGLNSIDRCSEVILNKVKTYLLNE